MSRGFFLLIMVTVEIKRNGVFAVSMATAVKREKFRAYFRNLM